MKKLIALLVFATVSAHAALPAPGTFGAPKTARYCGEPERDQYGNIKRSQAVLREFVQGEPCPKTLEAVTSCEGWQIDHIVPLASGGCDAVHNLQWLPKVLKTCAGVCKDRWERRYHSVPRQKVELPPVKLVPTE